MEFNKKYPYLIAEIGNSHEGDFNICKQSITEAKKAGADCVKFQLFNYKTIVKPNLKIIKHAKSKFKFQFERFKSIQLNIKKIKILSKLAKKKKIDFSVSVFDHRLVKEVSKYVTFFKVASGDITYLQLLKEMKKTKKKVVLSTGMSNLKEILEARKIIGKKNCHILHCISKYPSEIKELNLNSIVYLREKLKQRIGFSDHSRGIEACIAASTLGAHIIEKHFIPINSKKNSADRELSIKSNDFLIMKKKIEEAIEMLGKKTKKLFKWEKYYKKNLRRSVYFNKDIRKGSIVKKSDFLILRPFSNKGIDQTKIINFSAFQAKRNYKKFSLFKKNK